MRRRSKSGGSGGVGGKTTAGPSTALRSAQDDNSLKGRAVTWGPDDVRPAMREETVPVAMAALLLAVAALVICFSKGYVLLYGDAVGTQERVTFTVSVSSARHKALLKELIACDATDHVVSFKDEEED